jgi:hypothetical protein
MFHNIRWTKFTSGSGSIEASPKLLMDGSVALSLVRAQFGSLAEDIAAA